MAVKSLCFRRGNAAYPRRRKPSTVGAKSIIAGQNLDDFYEETTAGAATSYVSDGLGGTVAVTNSPGAIVGNDSYGPYGTTTQSGTTAA